MPSMTEAAQIRDVQKRHSYVFDSGLSSPDFFDVEKRMMSEEFRLLQERIIDQTCDQYPTVLEIGCFTGLNLIGLAHKGVYGLVGVDFVEGAIKWLDDQSRLLDLSIRAMCDEFPDGRPFPPAHNIVCFDVLEHQLNVGNFLRGVSDHLCVSGSAYFLVPEGESYYDCGHVAFFPDVECLRNVLDYYFEVEELFELKTCRKMFASCRRRESIPGIPKKQEPIRATAVDRVAESLADGHLE